MPHFPREIWGLPVFRSFESSFKESLGSRGENQQRVSPREDVRV